MFQCRKLLYDLAQLPYSEESDPPEKPSGWKRACAVVLSQKVLHYFKGVAAARWHVTDGTLTVNDKLQT